MAKRSIKGIRNDLNLSQVEMAEKLKVPYATYQRYERLETTIPAKILIKVADLVGITDVREIKIG